MVGWRTGKEGQYKWWGGELVGMVCPSGGVKNW